MDSDSEDGSDESLFLPEEYEEEVDINIHFHCEHCVKMGRCQERPKPGWACDIDYCPNGCGHRSVKRRKEKERRNQEADNGAGSYLCHFVFVVLFLFGYLCGVFIHLFHVPVGVADNFFNMLSQAKFRAVDFHINYSSFPKG